MRKLLALLVLAPLAFFGLVSCDPPPDGNPSAGCPSGWTFVSTQGWWQDDRNGDGTVDFPQSTNTAPGGHIHEDFCFPVNKRVDGTIHFEVNLRSHQNLQVAEGHSLDIGLAPGGDSMARVAAPDMDAPPNKGKRTVTIPIDLDTDKLPSGLQSLRFRYLPFETPDPHGRRVFISTELPLFVRTNPSGEGGQVGGKGWDAEYANARFDNNSLFGRALSGTVQVPVYTKGLINRAFVHMDAHFGDDNTGVTVASRAGEFRGDVPLDTTQFTNGWHCLAIRADGRSPVAGVVNTGIIEMPVLIQNEGQPDGNGHGSCFPS